jgi:hypothetical protein
VPGKGIRRLRLSSLLPWVLAGVAVLLCVGVRATTPYTMSGDEPHYLVIAGSIIHDGDVDVKNDYQLGRYRAYYPDTIDPHVNRHLFSDAGPHWYSYHEVGMPVLLVPLTAAWGATGAEATMVIVAIALLVVTYRWSLRVLGSRPLALLSVAALAISSFFLGLQGYIFPDLVVALLLVSGLLLLERSRTTVALEFLLGTLLGVAIWVHVRVILIFVAIGLVALWQVVVRDRHLGRNRMLVHAAALTVPPLLLVGLFELKVHEWFGSWNPTIVYQGQPSVLQVSPLFTFPRLLFGGTQGVFPNNPIWLVAVVGTGVWFVRNRPQLLRVLAVTVPTILLISTFAVWRGGTAPPGRYAMSILPAFAPAIGWAAREARTGVTRTAIAALFVAQALFSVIDGANGGFQWGSDPVLTVLQQHLSFVPAAWVPNFDNSEVGRALNLHEKVYVLGLVILLLALLAAGYVASRRGRTLPRTARVEIAVGGG